MSKIHKPWLTQEDLEGFLPGGAVDVLDHAAEHEVGGGDLVSHNSLTDWAANKHVVLPGTIAAVLSDHNVAAHDALDITELGTVSSGVWEGTAIANGYIAGIDQNLLQASSPTFVTVKLSGLTDGYVPYHVSDAAGLADSPIFVDGAKVGIGTPSPVGLLDLSSNAVSNFFLRDPTLTFITAFGVTDIMGSFVQKHGSQGGLAITGQTYTGATDRIALTLIGAQGKTSPTQPAVAIEGYKSDGADALTALTGAEIVLQVRAGTSPLVTVEASGDVGIGTAGPNQKLQVQDGNIVVDGPGYIGIDDAQANSIPRMGLMRKAGFFPSFAVGSGTDFIWVVSDGTTIDEGGTFTELMRLKRDTGKLGIGTASPAVNLHLSRTAAEETGGLRMENLQPGGYGSTLSWFSRKNWGDNASIEAAKIQVRGQSNWASEAATDSYMAFWTMNNAVLAERIRILSDGKVGINVIDPDEQLEVNGNIKADTFLLASGITPNLAWLSDVTLGILEEGETLRYDQWTGEWVDAWGISYDNPRLVYKMYTDFFSSASDSNDPWVGLGFGGGASGGTAGTSNHPGIITFSANVTNSGYRFLTATNCILIAGAEHSEFSFRTGPIQLNVRVRLGYQDSISAAAPTDGVWIDISGVTLTGKTDNNGAGPSTTGTSYALDASTWYRGKIAVVANQALTLLALGYVNCVGGDIGKQVQVDGEEFGLLDDFDNVTRVWRVTTGRLIPDGSAITITDGTGEGTADGISVTTIKEVVFTLYTLVAGEQTVVWTDELATNIPTAAGRETGHGIVMYVAANVARTFDVDMMIATRAGYITR